MSHKCPTCKKCWLAAGQTICKCGAGEEKSTLPFADQKACDELLARLDSIEYIRLLPLVAEAVEMARNREVAKYWAATNEPIHRAVQCASVELLQLLLPHVTRPLHTVLVNGLSVVSAAVLRGRLSCLKVLLADMTRLDASARDKTELTVFELASKMQISPYSSPFLHYWLVYDTVPFPVDAKYEGKKAFDKKLKDEIFCFVAVATGNSGAIGGVTGMMMRAQHAAVEGSVSTPPLFPRALWVTIVAACDVLTRAVLLPRVCRFFRNLLTGRNRCAEVLTHCGVESWALGECENAPFVAVICRQSFAQSWERAEWVADMCRLEKKMSLLDVSVLVDMHRMPRPADSERFHPSYDEVLPSLAKDGTRQIVTARGASALLRIASKSMPAQVELRLAAKDRGSVSFVWTGMWEQLGAGDSGSSAIQRLQNGIDAVARIWEISRPLSPQYFCLVAALAIETHVSNRLYFYKSFLCNLGDSLVVTVHPPA